MEVLVTEIEVVVFGPVCSQMSPGPEIPSHTMLGGLRKILDDQSLDSKDVFSPAFVALSSLSHISKSTDQN